MIWSILLTALVVIVVLNPFGLRDRVLQAARSALGRATNFVLGAAFLAVVVLMLVLSIPHFR